MKHLSNGSDFCQFLYDTAASDPGRNLVFETDGQRVIVIQKAEDADIVMRRNLANYPKNLRWFEQVAGNSRLTDEGEAWKFRWSLSQPFFSKYDAERGYEVSLIHARNMARRLPQAQGVLLDEAGIHESMLSIFVQMFLEIELASIPMAHDSCSRLIELASAYAFTAPGSDRTSYSREHLSEILSLRKQIFAALQQLRHLREPSAMLEKMLQAESEPGFDFQFEKELILLFGAGTDTAAYTVGWALHLLALDPELQQRLRGVVDAIYAEHTDESERSKALMASPELKHFIAEVLRLFPPLPFVTRSALQADQLSDISIKPGDVIIVSLVGINTKGLQRANPWVPDIDAAALEGSGMGTGAHTGFIWGPRVCGGRNFSLLELTIVLSELLHDLRFEATENTPLEYEWIGQMRRKGGHRVKALARQ